MAKTIYIDKVWAITHYNGSPESYRESSKLGPFYPECCYCHKNLSVGPINIGSQELMTCHFCKKKIVYRLIQLNYDLANVLNVRDGIMNDCRLLDHGVMHITLPINHPEFSLFIKNPFQYNSSNKPDYYQFAISMNQIRNYLSELVQSYVSEFGNVLGIRKLVAIEEQFRRFGELIIPGVAPKIDHNFEDQIRRGSERIFFTLSKRYLLEMKDIQFKELNLYFIEICEDIFFERLDSSASFSPREVSN